MKDTYEGAFIGGHPALDFVNTVRGKNKNREESRIKNWEQFQSWACAAGILPKEHLNQLNVLSRSSNKVAILNVIHQLRESTYNVLSSIASGGIPCTDHRHFMEDHIKTAIKNGMLHYKDGVSEWAISVDHPEWLTGTLALSIENLLRSQEFGRLRECGRCSWLFLDTGRGRGRRWCDMRTCGNRAKSQSFKSRHKD